jgi:hypothetical protein
MTFLPTLLLTFCCCFVLFFLSFVFKLKSSFMFSFQYQIQKKNQHQVDTLNTYHYEIFFIFVYFRSIFNFVDGSQLRTMTASASSSLFFLLLLRLHNQYNSSSSIEKKKHNNIFFSDVSLLCVLLFLLSSLLYNKTQKIDNGEGYKGIVRTIIKVFCNEFLLLYTFFPPLPGLRSLLIHSFFIIYSHSSFSVFCVHKKILNSNTLFCNNESLEKM